MMGQNILNQAVAISGSLCIYSADVKCKQAIFIPAVHSRVSKREAMSHGVSADDVKVLGTCTTHACHADLTFGGSAQ